MRIRTVARMIGRQIVEGIDQALELGSEPVDLVDQVEQDRHVLFGETKLVFEIADQRCPREVGLREGLRSPCRPA